MPLRNIRSVSGNPTPPTRAIVFILVFLGLGLAAGLFLYALTPPTERPNLLNRIGTWLPSLVIVIPAVLSWIGAGDAADSARAARNTAQRAETKVDHVIDQVNGHSDALDPLSRSGGTVRDSNT